MLKKSLNLVHLRLFNNHKDPLSNHRGMYIENKDMIVKPSKQ